MKAPPARPMRERLLGALGERSAPLRVVLREAERAGSSAFLVGGPVRDFLLGEPIGDLDVLLSGGLERIAQRSARCLGGRAVVHPRFQTATIEVGALRIDLSRARRERYVRPGALPEVAPATPAEDLCRRDFSINAMALPMDARSGAALLDPCGGLADLEGRLLRVLHPQSFLDDPTRMLRAMRYLARLGLRLARETGKLLREAVAAGALGTLSRERIFHELEHMLDEAWPARSCALAASHGLLSAISRGWQPGRQATLGLQRLGRAKAAPPWTEVAELQVQRDCGLRLLLLGARADVRERHLRALGLQGRSAQEIDSDLRKLAGLQRTLSLGPRPGRLDAILCGLSEPMLLLLHCTTPARTARGVRGYARVLRHRVSPIDGHAARALGLEGPAIGTLMRAARRRALDGAATDAGWLRGWLARRGQMR